jgi:hypothetical protein
MAARRKTKTKTKAAPRKPVSQAQARLFGIVARKGAGSARKVRRGELSRPEAKGALRGVKVSALPPRKRSTTPTPTPTATRPKRQRTAAQRAATRKRNARRAAGY